MSERTPEVAAFTSYKEALQEAVSRAQRLSSDFETRYAIIDEHMARYSRHTQDLVGDLRDELSHAVTQYRTQARSTMEHDR